MQPWTFHPGDKLWAPSDALEGSYSAFFEDDGETGYFYAYDRGSEEHPILDGVFIYNVKDVKDREKASELMIYWADTHDKCALVINDYAHAAFDFAARRGMCRADYPNFERTSEGKWPQSDHSWSDAAVAWLYGQNTESKVEARNV
ncbi:MAG: DUF2251 domain-containing protein [Acidobacteriota bacterium]